MATQTKRGSVRQPRVPGFGRTITILVVEDDAAVGELLRTVLNAVPGWGAVTVQDAAAARAVFGHVRVDLLVLDVNLADVSGPELLRVLRKDAAWNDPPVLLMSADAGQPAVLRALERGEVDRFLPKPLDVDGLLAAVHRLADSPMRSAETAPSPGRGRRKRVSHAA